MVIVLTSIQETLNKTHLPVGVQVKHGLLPTTVSHQANAHASTINVKVSDERLDKVLDLGEVFTADGTGSIEDKDNIGIFSAFCAIKDNTI